jgi:simple sugar transport system permease protein
MVPYLVALAALFALSYRNRPRLIRETLDTMRRALTHDQQLQKGPTP